MRKASIFILVLAFAGCDHKAAVAPTPTTDCICTEQYDPVCGADGKTYSNACKAACAGITSYVKGDCK